MKFNPPDYLWILIILELILNFFIPIKKIIPVPYNYFGILLIIFGIYLNISVWAVYKKLKNLMSVHEKPRVLITSGVFRISRNPIYLGMLLILIGEAIILGSLTPIIVPLIFFILIEVLTIPIEERNLEKKFRKEYIDYKDKTRKWI